MEVAFEVWDPVSKGGQEKKGGTGTYRDQLQPAMNQPTIY